MFFEVRTKRLTVTERNAYKTVKELWLFQVESYTEAEARVTEFMNKQFKGEDFSIPKIQPSKIQRVEKTDGCADEDPFYKVKIELLSENDKGKVVKEPFFILVRAEVLRLLLRLVMVWAMKKHRLLKLFPLRKPSLQELS